MNTFSFVVEIKNKSEQIAINDYLESIYRNQKLWLNRPMISKVSKITSPEGILFVAFEFTSNGNKEDSLLSCNELLEIYNNEIIFIGEI